MVFLAIRVPRALRAWLAEEAERNGLTTAGLVRHVLTRYKSAKS